MAPPPHTKHPVHHIDEMNAHIYTHLSYFLLSPHGATYMDFFPNPLYISITYSRFYIVFNVFIKLIKHMKKVF